MAKLMAVLMLVSTHVEIEGELVKLECGRVYDLEPKQAKSLLKHKEADDNPITIAYHRGDLALYEKLLRERDAEASKSKKGAGGGGTGKGTDTSTSAGAGSNTGAGTGADTANQPAQLSEAQLKAQADAQALEEQAAQEQDPAKAQGLRDEAQALLKAAGLVVE